MCSTGTALCLPRGLWQSLTIDAVPQVRSHPMFSRRAQLKVVSGEGPSVQLGTAKLPSRSVAQQPDYSCCCVPRTTPPMLDPQACHRMCARTSGTHPCIDHMGVTAPGALSRKTSEFRKVVALPRMLGPLVFATGGDQLRDGAGAPHGWQCGHAGVLQFDVSVG